ncbi:MAG: HupE/UreJ family protein [Gemmatimonadota bacterium]|nr:HupE/UreJ family protein [Gemmatimonadota bacterium]
MAAYAALAIALPKGVAGHDVRPGYLELREQADGTFAVVWKQPTKSEVPLEVDLVFPAGCRVSGVRQETAADGQVRFHARLTCPEGLTDQTIRLAGLEGLQTDVLVEIHYTNDTKETHLVRPASPSLVVGGAPSVIDRVFAYLGLGMAHIALGVDHLLFVLGLLLIVRDRRTLIKTITSFTVAHSITLGIATLGFASAPTVPLNAVIALSILFLGPEIVRVWRGQTSFTIRHPWVVAFAFGLLHGFGFASGLTSMGLPQSEIPLALLFFNVGVEIGQIVFVLLVLALVRSFRTLEIRWPRWVQAAPGYAVGSLGAMWTIDRVLVLMGLA